MAKIEIVREWREVQNECIGPEKTSDGAWEYYVWVTVKQIRRGKRGEYEFTFPKRMLTISGATKKALDDEMRRMVEQPNTYLVTEKGDSA